MKSGYLVDIIELPSVVAGLSVIFHTDTGMQENDGIMRAGPFHGAYSSVCHHSDTIQ